MGLLDAFRSKPTPAVARCVNVYVSDADFIVVAMHRNLDGIDDEQDDPLSVANARDAAGLGGAFQQAFDRFSVEDTNLRDRQRSDWPAWRASGVGTRKEFERRYRFMHCAGLNAANAVVRASLAHPRDGEIELATIFNPRLSPEQIGERLLRLLVVAREA